MKNKKKESFIIFLILGVIGAMAFYSAMHIPSGGSLGRGADFMPKIISVLLLVCALGFLVESLLAPATEKTERRKKDWTPLLRFCIALGMLILYVVLLKPVGFIVTTVLYIFAQSQFMVPNEKRSIGGSAVLAVVSAVLIYLVFAKGLSMVLPMGILDGLL